MNLLTYEPPQTRFVELKYLITSNIKQTTKRIKNK